jgi:hypothetical protein
MKPPMNHVGYKVNFTKNAYGDYTATSSTQLNCHFRYVNEVISASPNETIMSDAMAWFNPSDSINEQDIVMIDGNHYRVEKVIRARKLRSTTVVFTKCYLLRYGMIS